MMRLKIGDAEAFRRPEDWGYTPDDRQTKHEIIDGAIVEDYGHVAAGDVITCTVLMKYQEYLKVYNYWESRKKVKIVDHAGTEWGNMRVVIKKDTYVNYHESYHKLDLEFWEV